MASASTPAGGQTSSFFESSIGLKTIMAGTGILLLFFVVGHLLGNLQVFLGPEAINRYALWLRNLGGLLWLARIGILLAFALHIISAIKLQRMNAAARPVPYAVKRHVRTSFPSATMFETGLLILAFVIFHLAHFTLGYVEPGYFELHDSQGRHDVYRMIVLGFENRFYFSAYIFFMLVLGFHLSHGISSVFQTLGLTHSSSSRFVHRVGPGIAWILALGYIAIPVAVMLGVVR